MKGDKDIFDVWASWLTLEGTYDLCDREIAFKFPGYAQRYKKNFKSSFGSFESKIYSNTQI